MSLREEVEALTRYATPGPWWNETHVVHAADPDPLAEPGSTVHPVAAAPTGQGSRDANLAAAAPALAGKLGEALELLRGAHRFVHPSVSPVTLGEWLDSCDRLIMSRLDDEAAR